METPYTVTLAYSTVQRTCCEVTAPCGSREAQPVVFASASARTTSGGSGERCAGAGAGPKAAVGEVPRCRHPRAHQPGNRDTMAHAVPPVRPASMYAAKFRGGPGPGTYEQPTLIITPRGSPRGTFGTGPQRAIFGNQAGPPPGQYTPKKAGKVIGEYSFGKDSRFKDSAGSGDPGAYNPRPRSEGRAPAAYSIKVRHASSSMETPGPGAHDIARFGDNQQHSYDSFHRLAQTSSRFSFGTLARPLGGGMSPQQSRSLGRPDAGSPRGGWLGGGGGGGGGSGRNSKRSAAPPAPTQESMEPTPSAATTLRQMHGRAGRHPLQAAKDTRRFAPEERPAHGTMGPMDPPRRQQRSQTSAPGSMRSRQRWALRPTSASQADRVTQS